MQIVQTHNLTQGQKAAIYKLWNNEYPAQLGYENMAGLDAYLGNLNNPQHYFAIDGGDAIMGWAFSFVRENEKWFAIIVDSTLQKKGLGTSLLHALKENEPVLNGWVTDHYRYVRADGAVYLSPMQFYLKNGFTICRDTRLEFDKLSAVKIQWVNSGKANNSP
jgi:GNAT superfamily N-acetyltransferase